MVEDRDKRSCDLRGYSTISCIVKIDPTKIF